MDEYFLEAWVNRRHSLCGRTLHPFCLHDILALEAIESPLCQIWNGKARRIAITDLVLASLICSGEHEQWLDRISSRTGLAWHRFRTLWRSAIFQVELSRFEFYVADHLSGPEVWSDSSGSGTINAPWLLAKATYLMRNTSLTRTEVWTRPIGEILWYAAAVSEQMGGANILSESEREIVDQVESSRGARP